MALSNDLISQFAKLANPKTNTKTESTAYGTAHVDSNNVYVEIDGSNGRLTPVQTAVDVQDGERVIVSVKDHSVTITGNTSPTGVAARVETVQQQGKKLEEFDIIVSYKVTTEELSAVNATIENLKAISARFDDMFAITAEIENLQAKYANLTYVSAEEITALSANIESIKAMFGEFTDLSVEDLDVVTAEIDNLQAYNANFTYVSTELLQAYKASIEQLDAKKLSVDLANIDYANIDEATFKKFYAESGLIQDVVIDEAHVTSYIVGVTIKGDLIEAGTILADKLVVKGEDGLYYKLNTNGKTVETEQTEYNSLNGSVITAKSITAEKMNVSDLAAFKATIGGFTITPATYLYVKMEETIDAVDGTLINEVYTTTGEEVYYYVDSDNVPRYYCVIDSVYYNVSTIEDMSGAIYSGVKNATDNITNGMYLGADGQFALGDSTNYFKYYKDQNGDYKLELAAGKHFTLDDVGMTIEGNSDDGNNTIKTVISNNGMKIHVNDNSDPTLSADDKGVVAIDLHARTYLIVGENSRLEDYDVPRDVDSYSMEPEDDADFVYYPAIETGNNKTYTFSVLATILDPSLTEVMIQPYPDAPVTKCAVQQNGKIECTYRNKSKSDKSPLISIYIPANYTFTSWTELEGLYVSETFDVAEETTFTLEGCGGMAYICYSTWDGTTAPPYTVYESTDGIMTVTLQAGSYKMVLDHTGPVVTMTNNTANRILINDSDVKIIEHTYRTGCFWIGE